MRKLLAIYLAICSTAFLCTSCFNDDDEEIVTYPFAALTSFSIGSFKVYTPGTTIEGKDTTYTKIVSGSFYPFIIDQKRREVYNPDSLPMGADVTKLTTGVACDGLAYFYTDSTDTYEAVSSADSFDLSKPRQLFVASTSGTNIQSYTVRVNVHTLDPEKMYWQQLPGVPLAAPQRAIIADDGMLLFGLNAEGARVMVTLPLDNAEAAQAPSEISVAGIELSAIQQFAGSLYANDGSGALYSSTDGINWSLVASSVPIKQLIASQGGIENRLWAVTAADSIAYSTDGTNFVSVQKLDENFPLYNLSVAAYPLRTNPNILRTVITGYANDAEALTPQVWSILSSEKEWSHYKPAGDGTYDCPALKPLSVVHYDNSLYAFGGKGVVAGEATAAFKTIYTSRDNGLSWKALANVHLPAELADENVPFVALADEDNFLWIVAGGEKPVLWRGRINRLAF